jgi:FkbM family methyltransferase
LKKLPKKLAARLPAWLQHELRRANFAWSIAIGRFHTNEHEFEILDEFVKAGDWAIDIGANVGHYAFRLSRLVGERGRVIAIEPVPDTFAILAETARRTGCRNVTLINAAASAQTKEVRLDLPRFDTGLANFYQASITDEGGAFAVLALPVDALQIPARVSLVKIDVEGHEQAVLDGMRTLLARDHPVLIVEGVSPEIAAWLADFGYQGSYHPGSSNTVFRTGPGLRAPADPQQQ